jgi:F0F1-type ATP synthase assembly protein I
VLSTVSTPIYSADISNALSNDAFYVCISLNNRDGSRRAQASTNATMNVMYAGSQQIGVIGTLTNHVTKTPSSSGGVPVGTIVGAVVGSVVGACLLVTILIIAILIAVIIVRKRSVKVETSNNSLQNTANTV